MARPTVVLVESDRDMQGMVQSVIEQMDSADVVVAEDVAEAIREVRLAVPVLVIVDDEFPHNGVRDVINLMMKDPKTQFVPVVALTSEPERVRELTSLGVIACLRKPFDVVHLVDLVEVYTTPLSRADSGEEAA